MKNLHETIISQYANSPILCDLINRMNIVIDPTQNISEFYKIFWNVKSAEGFGLDFWGKVVGIERQIYLTAEDEFIGFSNGFTPFNQGSWASDGVTDKKYTLDDETYRKVILLKAFRNIIYATFPNINQLLRIMFQERGRAYIVKNNTMSARYVFEFTLLPIERAIIRQTNILPTPSGVLIEFYEPEIDKTFGFTETGLAPFGQGAFFMGENNR